VRELKPCAWRDSANYIRPIPCEDQAEYTVTLRLPNGDAVEVELCPHHTHQALELEGTEYA
jgi:hypothetical protein